MGSSASVNTNQPSLFSSKAVNKLRENCSESSKVCKAFAKHIKDGSWMDRLGRKVPKSYGDEETGYILPKGNDGEIHALVEKSNFNMDEHRLFFLNAVSDDFIAFAEKSTRIVINDDYISKKGSFMFQEEEEDISRSEVNKAELMLLNAAMHFDEEEYVSFLGDSSWSHDLYKMIHNLSVPITIVDTYTVAKFDNNLMSTSPIVYANKSWEAMSKLKLKDCMNKSFEDIILGSDTEKEQIELLNNSVKSALSIKIGVTCHRKNNDPFLDLMGVVPIVTDKNGTFRYVAVVHCDNSKQKNLEKNLSVADEVMTLLPFIIKTPEDVVFCSAETDPDDE